MSATIAMRPQNVLRYTTLITAFLPLKTTRLPMPGLRPYTSIQPATRPSFTYRLAAASAGKRTPPRPPKQGQDFFLYTSTDPTQSPPYLHSTKPDSGEDAFFATTIGDSPHHVAFGVADGVGGWQDQGVDPSDFSHGLCGLMAGTAHLHTMEERGPVKPKLLLQTAYDAIIANPRIIAGGSTASLAVMDGSGNMEAANLGDSGFLILSPGKVAYRSDIQTHAFNTPFQLSKVPAKMLAQHRIFGGGQHFSEVPEQADVTRHAVKHGDIVVFATDGVWDNLSAQDTLSIVTRVMEEHGYWTNPSPTKSNTVETVLNASLISSLPKKLGKLGEKDTAEGYLPGLLATAIMREAKVAGLDRRRDGPFAKEVKMHFPQEGWQGGKPDDIAVVVCVAVDGAVEAAAREEEEEKPIKAKL